MYSPCRKCFKPKIKMSINKLFKKYIKWYRTDNFPPHFPEYYIYNLNIMLHGLKI